MTREKAGLDTIMDLSWPKTCGVNDGVENNTYLNTQFKTPLSIS